MKHIVLFILLFCCCGIHSADAKSRKKITDTIKVDSLSQDLLVQHYANFMKVSDTTLVLPDLYILVNDWLGTPYKYGRKDKKGTDCSGLVGNIFSHFSSEQLPRSAAGMSKVIESKPISELQEGDLVFFNYYGRINSHVGIYLQNGWFIHASSVKGVTLNNLNSKYYKNRFSKGGPLKQGRLHEIVKTEDSDS